MVEANTKDIGKLSGKVMVFGGPYSNIQALEALKKIADMSDIHADQIICTGDIVGYCAHPSACIQFIKDWGIHSIKGNVEFSLIDEEDDCGCNFNEGSRCDLLSKQWFPYAKREVKPDHLEFLAQLPEFIKFEYSGKSCFVLHGGYDETSAFIFESTSAKVKARTLKKLNADLIVAGHCGIPFFQSLPNGSWLNAGVIGMPANDGTLDTWYVILDENEVGLTRLTYDYIEANKAMMEKGLPKAYAKTLLTGIWDNCEILPEIETNQQGIPIKEKVYKLKNPSM